MCIFGTSCSDWTALFWGVMILIVVFWLVGRQNKIADQEFVKVGQKYFLGTQDGCSCYLQITKRYTSGDVKGIVTLKLPAGSQVTKGPFFNDMLTYHGVSIFYTLPGSGPRAPYFDLQEELPEDLIGRYIVIESDEIIVEIADSKKD